MNKLFGNESEKTEAKKDLNWFKEQLDDIEMNTPRLWSHDSIWMLDRVNELLNQLDEPEVLSQEWIEENKKDSGVHYIDYYVPIGRLHDLLVPKPDAREQLEIAYKDILERGEFWFDDKRYVVVEKKTVEEEWVMEWLDNNDFYDHKTAETVLANAVDKGELGYYGTKYAVVEKPVIPKFVAEVIVEDKELGYDVYESIDLILGTNGGGLPSISNWVARNIDKYARAWLDGYTVEEEQKYYVLVRDEEYGGFWFLFKNKNGGISIGVNRDCSEVDWDTVKLTEQEIKDYDERYWAFKVPVEEVE